MSSKLTPRQKFIMALEGKQPPGLVPHFELRFFLTMEVFGKVHPEHRNYHQWDQMEEKERQLHRRDIAQLNIDTARKFGHSAIFLTSGIYHPEEVCRVVELIREQTGDEFFIMHHGDATFGIPNGNDMVEFSYRVADDPDGVKREAQERIDNTLAGAEKYYRGVFDGFALCSDYCLNTGPFLSPDQFGEFVTPYLAKLIDGYRKMGFYTIKHTDGNIMPIIDQLVQSKPHALHSLDPQAGVDIAQIKKMYGKQVCMIGNVNCGKLDTGTDEEARESAHYALKHGMPGGGYIFSTSNCIYTGMRLSRYEMILDIWQKEGRYPD
jgi:uroporphyrinogen decarboxylase